jgi:FMN phosphatase YigB (HAD superfamily)
MLEKIWNILIDFDGTLHDTESVYASKLDGLFDLAGEEVYHIFLVDIHRKIVHNWYPNRHEDLDLHWRLLLQHFRKPYDSGEANLLAFRLKEAEKIILEKPKLFHEAPQFLDNVVKAGHRLCLSTGGQNSVKKAEALTRVLGTNYFCGVLGEEIIGYLKHEPTYYEKALKRLSWRAENTVSIGDTILTDICPAKAVGFKTIWVNRRDEKRPTEPERTPDYETTNLISALDFLHEKSF